MQWHKSFRHAKPRNGPAMELLSNYLCCHVRVGEQPKIFHTKTSYTGAPHPHRIVLTVTPKQFKLRAHVPLSASFIRICGVTT